MTAVRFIRCKGQGNRLPVGPFSRGASMFNWLRHYGGLPKERPVRKPNRRILRVDCLEDRCVLSGVLQTNLVSDLPGMAQVTDANLVNPWGLSYSPSGPFWVSDNGAG